MKAFILLLLIGVMSYVAGIWFPWWSIAVVAFIILVIVPLKPGAAFLIAFAAIFLLWFFLAFFRGLANDHLLDGRIAELFLHARAPVIIAVITGVIGGLVAGFAGLSASFLRNPKINRCPPRVRPL